MSKFSEELTTQREAKGYYLVLMVKSGDNVNLIIPAVFNCLDDIPSGTRYVVLSRNATIKDRNLVTTGILHYNEFKKDNKTS